LIIEFSQFHTRTTYTASKVKSFLSRRIDAYRSPYGRITEDHPRQCITAATINPSAHGYLINDTGNVRFWCVVRAVGLAT
jgi:predicted P-loop ATPase